MKIVLLIILVVSELFAAFEYSGYNAFLNGIANSSVATNQIFSAFLLNPAVSAMTRNSNLGLTYFKPYGLKEVDQAEIILNTNVKNNGVGMALSAFGNAIYRENRVTVNMSRPILEKRFSFGMNVHWYSLTVEDYGSAHAIGFDAGIQYLLNSAVILGVSVRNINQPALNGYREDIPVITSLGMSFDLEDKLQGFVSVQKDAWFPVNVLFGVNFRANRFLSVQSGFTTDPSVPCLGIKLQKDWLMLNYVFRHHFDLGTTHLWGISLTKEKGSK